MNIEKWDQYLLLPILILIALITIAKLPITLPILIGAILFMIGLLAFNKGRKTSVNLSSDVTYIAIAYILLSATLYYLIFITFDTTLLALAILLIMIIAILYK